MGAIRYSIFAALCFIAHTAAQAQSANEWYGYRYNNARIGTQPFASDLSDPNKVRSLAIRWAFEATPPGPFKASPIVVDDTVFIGNTNGYFYALDAATGRLKWRYPKDAFSGLQAFGDLFVVYNTIPPLRGSEPIWDYGIQAPAAYWQSRDAVIFGAQDQSLGQLGSGARLFALDAKTGTEIWKSDPIATIDGTTQAGQKLRPPPASLVELHQRIAFSAPLIFNNRVYIGIHDTGDSPVQLGRVVAVDLNTGHIDRSFQFQSVGVPGSPPNVRGGGVWNAVASDGTAVYFTTGNTRIPWCVYPFFGSPCPGPFEPEPLPNHGLSMIRADKDTGNIIWDFRAVDWAHDGDPDWAAGATVMSTSCGALIASVQKDGWSYAVNAADGKMRWQFPPTIDKIGLDRFLTLLPHGDDDYRRPGAAWNDVFIVRTGGEALDTSNDHVRVGYGQIHALNVCATDETDRVRWIADIPNIPCGNGNCVGAIHVSYSTPTVTGGIVFIGTNEDPNDHKGHLVVLGDPSVVPPAGMRCSNSEFDSSGTCPPHYVLVPKPTRLADVPMPDGGSLAAMRNEPVLAKGRVFVATSAGHVYMLKP